MAHVAPPAARSGPTVGVDVGGTKVQGVLVDDDGTVLAERHARTVTGPAGVAGGTVALVQQLLADRGLAVTDVAGVGIGLPGVVDPQTGTAAHAVNLGLESPVPLAQLVADGLGDAVHVRVENDLNVAVVGAAHVLGRTAAGPDLRDVAYVALGTGVAAGLLLDGTLRRGSHRVAGEIGHLTFVPDGRPCKCGQLGCLEQYASGSAIEAAWPSRHGRPAPAELFEAAAAGDPAAVALRDEVAAGIAAAVRLLVLTCDVDLVVLGGGVSRVGPPLLAAVAATLDRQAAASPFLASLALADRVRLAPADVPVGALGAALVARAHGASRAARADSRDGTDSARVDGTDDGTGAARVDDEGRTV